MDHVLDTNVLIHGRGADFENPVTVPGVVEEVETDSAEMGLQAFDLQVEKPSEKYSEKVRELSDRISSPTSETDEDLVALALERDAELVSDDKGVQNLADHLGIEYSSFNDDEIDEKKEWKEFCPSCGKETEDNCSRCGKESIRKPV